MQIEDLTYGHVLRVMFDSGPANILFLSKRKDRPTSNYWIRGVRFDTKEYVHFHSTRVSGVFELTVFDSWNSPNPFIPITKGNSHESNCFKIDSQ